MQNKSCDTVATYKPLCFKTTTVKKPQAFKMHQKAIIKLGTLKEEEKLIGVGISKGSSLNFFFKNSFIVENTSGMNVKHKCVSAKMGLGDLNMAST